MIREIATIIDEGGALYAFIDGRKFRVRNPKKWNGEARVLVEYKVSSKKSTVRIIGAAK